MSVYSNMSKLQLQDAIVEVARLRGWDVADLRPTRDDAEGFPHLVLVRERVIYATIKSEDGSMDGSITVMECVWRNRLAAAGQECYLWQPRDWHNGTIDQILRRWVAPAGCRNATITAGR